MRLLILVAGLSASASALAADTRPARGLTYTEGSQPEATFTVDPGSRNGIINPNGPLSSLCPPTSRYEAARRGGKLGPRLLTELPGADLYKAVYRRIGDCEVPIVVRYNIGETGRGR